MFWLFLFSWCIAFSTGFVAGGMLRSGSEADDDAERMRWRAHVAAMDDPEHGEYVNALPFWRAVRGEP